MSAMNLRHTYGIDMGTGSVKIYDRSSDAITKEMNMIAIKDRDTVFAVGNDAYEIFEKNPEDLQLITPMKMGRIQDVLMMEAILHTLLSRISRYAGYMPVMYFSVPLDMTELERRAYSTIARKGRFRRSTIYFVEKPVADAIALGIPVHSTNGTMIVNIGSQSTEVSILAEGRVIISRLIDKGGQEFNSAIVSGVRRRNGLTISRRTAQKLKFTLSDLNGARSEGCRVTGVDDKTGLPREGIVSSDTVSGGVRSVLSSIADEMLRMLERIPPQIRSAISGNGIYLSGGCVHIRGLTDYIQNALPYPVIESELYEFGTVTGLKQIINHAELRRYASSPAKRGGRERI